MVANKTYLVADSEIGTSPSNPRLEEMARCQSVGERRRYELCPTYVTVSTFVLS